MDFHLVLQADVTADVSLELLNSFLVHYGRPLSRLRGVIAFARLSALYHVDKSVFHTLLNEVFALDGNSAQRSVGALACHLAQIALRVFLVLAIVLL